MAVLRIHRSGFVLCLSFFVAACSGSSGSSNSPGNPINVSGSVGDGPVIGADVRVTDANGHILEERTSDELASYQLTVPAHAELPVLVTAAGGTDLVTGRELDFTLVGAVLDRGAHTVNLSPLSTVAVRAAQCLPEGLTSASLANAWTLVHDELSMGLDEALVADPMSEPVTADTVASVVLASEAFGETVRRTLAALNDAGHAISGDEVLHRVACDLVGQPAQFNRANDDPQLMPTFKSAELVVRLETLAGRLEVDGESAVSRMNDAIRTIRSDVPEPAVEAVPVTVAARDQAVALLTMFQSMAADDSLVDLAVALSGAAPDAVTEWVDDALDAGWQANLEAMTTNLAYADETAIDELEQRREALAEAEPPEVSLAAEPLLVAAGNSAALSWASNGAESCVAGGGWSGTVDDQGAIDTGPLQAGTLFSLTCIGPGGVTQRSLVVSVEGTDTPDEQAPPEPVPAPEPPASSGEMVAGGGNVPGAPPAPVVSLRVADGVVANGVATELSWSASNASSCTASGGWSGSKGVSGSQTTPLIDARTTFTLTCSGEGGSAVAMISVSALGAVSLSWQAPTENTDSSPLTDLDGYRIYYGQTSGDYTDSVDVASPATTSHSMNLPSGSYYIAMTAVDGQGNESAYSNEVLRVVD